MNVDWAVAIAVFAGFVMWSVVYYLGMFGAVPDIGTALDPTTSRIVDFLETESTEIPVLYDSPVPGTQVLYADLDVPSGSESGLEVLSGSSNLDCMLQGSRIYWEDSLSTGDNIFSIRYSDTSHAGCIEILSTSGSNQTIPLAAVKTPKVSTETLAALSGVPYENFRSSLGITNNLRIEWSGPIQGTYGPEPPINTDISVSETKRPHLETGGEVTIKISFWE